MSLDPSFAPFPAPTPPGEFRYPDMPVQPGPGQRWSTWPSAMPTERGPEPWPEWLVTAAAAFDTELGIVKSGKEADLFLIERAVPDDPARGCLLAAKRYRGSEQRDFHRSAVYTEGRRERRSRDQRAIERKTSYGREVQASAWSGAEFTALCRLYSAGVAVPYPVQLSGTEVLMEFVGEGRTAAPRLAQSGASRSELAGLFEQAVAILCGIASMGCAHGDLSAYNLLVHRGRVVAIDVPQLVDVVSNPMGMPLLERDCRNVCDWFARRGHPCDADEVFARAVAEVF